MASQPLRRAAERVDCARPWRLVFRRAPLPWGICGTGCSGGTVTDFLQFFFGQYEFPSFNAADSMITIGAVLLLLDLFLTRHQTRSPRATRTKV